MVRFVRSWQGIALIVTLLAAMAGGLWWLMRPPPVVDPLTVFKQKGTIVVGARVGAAPFSTLDENHNFVGYEPDIAKAIASVLGVKARFVAVDDSNALDFLKRGLIDFSILPRGGVEPRDPIIRYVQPGYFASGFNAVTLRDEPLKDWENLKGQPVCGLQANAPAKQIIEELGGSFIGFADRNSALQALTAERCSAFISDEVALRETLKDDVDHRFTMAFGTIDVAPWTIAVRAGDAALGDFIGKRLADFHRSGFLIKRADVWQLPANPYLETMHQNYKQ